MENRGESQRTVWDYLPATLAVVLGLLTNWLSDLWRPGVPIVVGGTLVAVLLLDLMLNRSSTWTGRQGFRALSDQQVLPIAAGAMIVGYGLGWLAEALPNDVSLSLGRGRTTMLNWAVANLLAALPAMLSAYRCRKPVWWATYIAFSGFGLATGLTFGSDADWFLRFFLQYLLYATVAAVVVQWGRHIVVALLDMMGLCGAKAPLVLPDGVGGGERTSESGHQT